MGRSAILSVGSALAIGLAAFVGSSSASGRAVPGNETPPSVSGQALEGTVLAANQGRWNHTSSAVFGYQWRRCLADGTACADIAGSTDNVYAARVDDVGHTLRVAVTATNRDGSTSAVSAPTAVVAALSAQAPHNGAPPTISGSPVVGRVVTATSGTWTGAAPIRFSYRWRRCSSSGGDCEYVSRHQAYRLSSADVDHSLRVLVTAGNGSGTASALSAPSGPVAKAPAPQPPQISSMPRITGTAQQGQQLVGTRGSWRNAPTRFGYSWLRCDRGGSSCGAIAGAHGAAYALLAADVGRSIRFQVDARNAGGSARAVSAPTAIVQATPAAAVKSPPVNTVKPTITGTAQEGQTLTGAAGSWNNSPTTFTYTWMRCNKNGNSCDSIAGANSTTYKLVERDVGETIRFRVRATNADGSSRETSNATAVVHASARPGNTSPPTISGTPVEGGTLSGNRGSWSHSPTSYDFFWLRCDRNGNNCNTIGGARSRSYVLTSADVGATLRFSVTAGNSEGTTSATSVPTGVVQRAPTPSRPPGCPPGNGHPDQVSGIAPPQRLLVDGLTSDPRVVTRGTAALIVRFHVSSSCGGSVQGALVYATATPYNQFSIPPEAVTGSDGWATLVFRRLAGFPVSNRQQLLTVFVRARKPGENLLLGISTRRLVSIPVRL
jgi:hypothetical protein